MVIFLLAYGMSVCPPAKTPTLSLNEQIRDSINPSKKWDTFLSQSPRRRGEITKNLEEGAPWGFEERERKVGMAAVYEIERERAYKRSIFLMRLKSGRAFLWAVPKND